MTVTNKELVVGDEGTEIRVQFTEEDDDGNVVVVPIQDSAETGGVLQVELTTPSGKHKARKAVFTTDGSDGRASYFTVAGDLDEAGRWTVCGVVRLPSPPNARPGKWTSTPYAFPVARACREEPGTLTPDPVVVTLGTPDPTVS